MRALTATLCERKCIHCTYNQTRCTHRTFFLSQVPDQYFNELYDRIQREKLSLNVTNAMIRKDSKQVMAKLQVRVAN